MRILVVASLAKSLINFRLQLLEAFVEQGHQVIACAPGTQAASVDTLKKAGVEYCDISLDNTGMNPAADVLAFIRLARLFRARRPDIVLTYTVKPVVYGSLAAHLVGVPQSYSMITGLGYAFAGRGLKNRLVNRLTRLFYRVGLSRNRAVFFQNSDDLALFVEQGLVAARKAVLIAGSGVDLARFRPAEACDQRPVFLLMSRLIRDKGIVEYVEAARILRQRYPNASFRLLGPFDSNPHAISRSELDSWQEEGIIEYLGETEDVRPFIASSGVFVLPSYYPEGTPRSILEAMAMARPVVTTDMPGCRQTVVHGHNGFLVPPRHPEALAEAMERFILHPELIELMGARSRKIAKETYDVHKVNAVILRSMNLVDEASD